jgi:arabinose-5-phosphate isomerase
VVNLASTLKQDGVAVVSITRGPEAVPPDVRLGGQPVSNVGDVPHGLSSKATTSRGTKASLERLATVALFIGPCDDAGISPAPTCSTTATLALGDALALCAARRRNFTDDDFAKRHPGGSLGALLRPVLSLVRFKVGQTIRPVPDDVTVAEAIQLSSAPDRHPGAILLVDRATGVLTGLFTDGDLHRLIERERTTALDRPIATVMTKRPGTLGEHSLVRDAVNMVREHRWDEIPVVDDAGKPIGLLDVQDLVAQRLIRSE